MNKNYSPITYAWEDSSIEAFTPNFFFFKLQSYIINCCNKCNGVQVSTIQNTPSQREITTLASCLNANCIARIPMSHQTLHNVQSLKRGSNMITIMLWTCHASKDLKKSKKSFITFIISSHTFVCRNKITISERSKTLDGLKSCNNLISMFTINVVVFVNASKNNQRPLD
jgi:hypothetical protein